VKSCLFHPAELNLRDALRNGAGEEEIASMIGDGIRQKPAGHPAVEELAAIENRSMIEIGG
jgi:molybdenum cofactor biosynthesis enzyme MoaA